MVEEEEGKVGGGTIEKRRGFPYFKMEEGGGERREAVISYVCSTAAPGRT